MINQRLRAAFFLIFAAVIPLRLAGQTYPWVHFTLNAGPTLDGTSLVYDPGSNQIIGFAGLDNGQCCNSENYVWLLTNANGVNDSAPQWTEQSPAGTPPAARSFASAVYDQTHNLMIVFGGGQLGGNTSTSSSTMSGYSRTRMEAEGSQLGLSSRP